MDMKANDRSQSN